ncbi:plasmid replication initiator protein [Cellulomonas algicola]|uniref:Plasmid replication initiator protein n=1 Tax=Cellulomonas algicola TaxID=2071633 RepID=A0A401V0X7_9CELL|nr:replication initiator [Cellulomonas algicola]GCD20559.1 plasmid replication initiator protein [Cellulomonas algicola]
MTEGRPSGFDGHGPESPLDLGGIGPGEAASIVGRLSDGTMPALVDALAKAGNCVRPVRLVGRSATVDLRTGEILSSFYSADEPLGALYKPCGNRREAVCASCSRVYARDTYELISTGLNGGKGVPATVSTNPLLFVTLTAPSFGLVHGVRDGEEQCHPRTRLAWCPHGRRLACWARHDGDDPRVGAPLCADCYDAPSAVIWQWHAPELWRRFTIALRRRLAAELGVRESDLAQHARLEYAKVAEFQARGVVHFHALVRLDGSEGPGSPAPTTASGLRRCVLEAAAVVRCTAPPVDRTDVERVLRFGAQTDVRIVREGGAVADQITSEQVAAYLAKYSTKSTGVDPRRPLHHLAALMTTCRTLAARALDGCPFGCEERIADRRARRCGNCARHPYALLGRWAAMLGFRGHFSTKSRRYSVTLGALRRARRRFHALLADVRRQLDKLDVRELEEQLMAADEETTLVIGSWSYEGTGWPRAGDKALADAAASRAREYAKWRAEQRTIDKQRA